MGISDNGAFNSNLANIASANYGPTATTNQANVNANTALVQQQAQGAQIQNMNAAISYQLRRNALTNFQGQQDVRADSSGTNSSSTDDFVAKPAAGAGAPQGGAAPQGGGAAPQGGGAAPQGGAATAAGDDSPDLSPVDEAAMESHMQSRYQVNPMGTPQEQQNIQMAALSGDEGLLKMATAQRDMNVGTRTFAAQQDAKQHSVALTAVETAPEGGAFSALKAVAPDAAAFLDKKFKNDSPEDQDERVRDWAAHVDAGLQRWTGDKIEKDDAGVYRNSVTGRPLPGVPIVGMSPKDYDAGIDKLNELVDSKTPDGTPTRVPQYRVNGYSSASANLAAIMTQQKAAATVPTHPALVGSPMDPTANPPGPNVTAQIAATAQKLRQTQAQQAQQPGAQQPGAQQPGGAPDNGTLPGVDMSKLPRPTAAKPVPGQAGLSPQDQITASNVATKATEQFADANTQYTEGQKSAGLIRAAQREANNLANNPRMVGPGSGLTQGLANLKAAVTGAPPDALVDFGSLNKILMTMGAQNIRQALSGQKITNQEFMTMLTKGNPNTEQPLATIQNLLGYLGTQNDYDTRFAKTKLNGLRSGADPRTIDADIASQSNRGDYVESRVGVRPPLQSAAPVSVTSPDQARALTPGTRFTTPDGRTMVR